MVQLLRYIEAARRGNLLQAARTFSALPLSDPAFIIWSPNTDIGKTVICGGLAKAAADSGDITTYTKPVQTGFPTDSDGRLVASILGCSHHLAPHASNCESGTPDLPGSASAQLEGRPVSDRELCDAVKSHVAGAAARVATGSQLRHFGIVETAGGVCSPTPAGSRQVDVLRNLRLPGVLIADPRLGGISTTLSALDSLTMQGHDIAAIAIMEPMHCSSSDPATPPLDNDDVIAQHISFAPGSTPPELFKLPPLGRKPSDTHSSNLSADSGIDTELEQWLRAATEPLRSMHAHLREWHDRRAVRLAATPAAARSAIWWPFTQHKGMTDGSITVIDARVGESYSVVRGYCDSPSGDVPEASANFESPAAGLNIVQEYDGCASWWTQGVSGELQPAVQRQMAYAAGRYMHVIFPEAVHQPALALSERLLATVGKGWAGKVFFSDDGSTAVEVALKMAFKKFAVTHGLDFQSPAARSLQVVALSNGYHGDTLGVMDCCPRSVFNEGQTPWYQPRGLFLEPPTCGVTCGHWEVRLPSEICSSVSMHDKVSYESKEALYSPKRLSSDLAALYTTHVENALDTHEVASGGTRIGACLLEPGMQGAGGMIMLDPLFQKILAQVCQQRGIPVIADEVFSGLWRLGVPSAAAAVGITPDVACYAKLLTAGSVPLAVTLASDDVFHAFDGDSKAQALLHGHSYTAHPVGCQVALAALDALGDSRYNQNILADGTLREMWPQAAITSMSHNPTVKRVVPLGTVLAVELRVPEGAGGYASGAARAVAARMGHMGVYARPLGNVAYVMCTPTTSEGDAHWLMHQLEACLMDSGEREDSSSSTKMHATA